MFKITLLATALLVQFTLIVPASAQSTPSRIIKKVENGLSQRAARNSEEVISPRAARRQAMREVGMPTSQQPFSQQSTRIDNNPNNPGGRQLTYKNNNGSGYMSAQHSLTDRVEGHGRHWEAGAVKSTGEKDPLNRPRLDGNKSKVEY